MADLNVEAKTMSSEKNISVLKIQNLQIELNAITSDPRKSIKKEEAEDKTQQLKSVILKTAGLLIINALIM